MCCQDRVIAGLASQTEHDPRKTTRHKFEPASDPNRRLRLTHLTRPVSREATSNADGKRSCTSQTDRRLLATLRRHDDGSMNRRPNLDDIEELLSRAQGQFETSFGSNGPILSAKQTNHQLETAVGRLLKGTSETLAAVPALEEIKRWVQVHWDIERETQPPDGTFAIDDEWVSECDAQLDALAAAVKLCLAALGHGTEIVAKCAIDFSRHGMIEVRSVYLFKGASLSRATVLDDHCTLVPYKEALHSVNSDSEWYRLDSIGWPPGDAVDVCALEAKSYEHPLCRHPEMRSTGVEYGRRLSPLLRSGAEVLGLILGLTWGTGHRAFGRCHGVAPAVSASLPFFRAGPRRRGIRQVLLTLPSLRQTPMRRPLNSLEVAELIRGYSVLPDQMRRIADLALRRLRDSTERIELEDKIVDLGIALEALFSSGPANIRSTVSTRASWYFADSMLERKAAEDLLKKFYDDRSFVVHGKTSSSPDSHLRRHENRDSRLAEVENVIRASLKSMISEGMPPDWELSSDTSRIRHDPSRAESDIPAMKSDSLSWSLQEQREIDASLEAVWKHETDSAPPARPDARPVTYNGIIAAEIERCKQQNTPYVISVPIRLYWAHPKWPKSGSDQVDERVKYYCNMDVERHLEKWRRAAAEKRMHQFTLPLEDSCMYLPERFDMWSKILSQTT